MPSSVSTWIPSSLAIGSSARRAVSTSSLGTVNDSSAFAPADRGSFWMIMSMLTLASASAVVTRPAMPGESGRPMSVTRASPREWVTAVMRGFSMFLSLASSSETTNVPSESSKLERQWMRTPWLRAYSTVRSCSTPAPDAAISSISSKVTTSSLRASGTIRGSR